MSVNVANVTSATAAAREVRSDMSSLSALPQEQTCERWELQADGLVESVRGDRFARHAAAVADVGAPVQGAVAVEQLGVEAGLRHADAIVAARHGREVENHHDEAAPILRGAHERDDAVLVVVA